MTALATGNRPHALSERGLDLYETPACATRALLSAERLPHCIWEPPAAGRGPIVRVLHDAGHAVIASDIVEREFLLHFVRDFLLEADAPRCCSAIVTNPPYRIAGEFVRHALDLCPRSWCSVASHIESAQLTEILERRGLARVHVFRNRLPMMHRDGWTGPRSTSAVPFAWFVFDRNYRGRTTLHRITQGRKDIAMNCDLKEKPVAPRLGDDDFEFYVALIPIDPTAPCVICSTTTLMTTGTERNRYDE
jgi:hypothetical protein